MSHILDGIPEEKLTAEQENSLAARKDDDRLNTLVLHNLREAFLYGRTCYSSIEEGETLSACYEGLLKAAKNFKPELGRFFAYSKPYCRGALNKIARSRDVVKRGPRELEELPNVEAAFEEIEDATAQEMCFPTSRVGKTKIEAPNTLPEFDDIHVREVWAQIEPAFDATLTAEESMVLKLIFLGGHNSREVGDLLDVTRERIRQIKNEAFRKLRKHLESTKGSGKYLAP